MRSSKTIHVISAHAEGEVGDIARLGVAITDAANARLGVSHPENADWDQISFCAFCGP